MLQFAKWDIRQSRLLRFPLTVLHISFLPSLSLSLSLQVMIPLCSFVSSQRLLHISLSIVCSVASVKPTRFLRRHSLIDVYKTSLMLEHSCLHPSLHHRHSPIKVCNNDHRHYIRRPSPSLHAASKWRNQMINSSVVDLY